MDTEFLRRRWTCLCWTHTRRVSLLPEFRMVAKGTSWICIHCMCGHFILLQSSPNWGVDEKFGCCYREFAANRRNLKIESSYLSSFFHRPSWLLAVSPRSPAGEFSSNKFAKYLGGGRRLMLRYCSNLPLASQTLPQSDYVFKFSKNDFMAIFGL